MDKLTVGGLIMAWGCVIAALILEKPEGESVGQALRAFMKEAPAILVFGGAFGAASIGISLHELKAIGAKVKRAFVDSGMDHEVLIKMLVDFAMISRRDGVLALENSIENQKDQYLVKGLQLLVDGVDTDRLRTTMEMDMTALKNWYKEGEEYFKALGGYAPTLGIIGTVLGLVSMLSNLENAESMGPAIASAFIATLYGISSANLVFLPLGTKIKNACARDIHEKKIILEGLLCIQEGVSPRMTEQTLHSLIYEANPKPAAAAKEK